LTVFKKTIKNKCVGEVCLAHDSVKTIRRLRLARKVEFLDYTAAMERGRILAAGGSLLFVYLSSPPFPSTRTAGVGGVGSLAVFL
jgi:hypothetical protein